MLPAEAGQRHYHAFFDQRHLGNAGLEHYHREYCAQRSFHAGQSNPRAADRGIYRLTTHFKVVVSSAGFGGCAFDPHALRQHRQLALVTLSATDLRIAAGPCDSLRRERAGLDIDADRLLHHRFLRLAQRARHRQRVERGVYAGSFNSGSETRLVR